MRNTWLLLPWAVLMSLIGVYVSFALVLRHAGAGGQTGFLASFCESDSESISCDEVLASPWSRVNGFRMGPIYWPPLPLAWYGLAYFSAMATWFVAIGRPSYSRRFWQLLPILANTIGLLISAFFLFVMATQLGKWCPQCVASHAVNFLLFPATLLLWPRRPIAKATESVSGLPPYTPPPQPESAFATQPFSEGPATVPNVGAPTPTVEPVAPARHRAGEPTIASLPHPTARTLFLVAALAVAIPAAELHFYGALQNKSIADAANNELREVVEDTQQLYAMYLNNAKHQFPDLDDDPIWQGTGDLPLVTAQMVVFSDFQCPHCRDFEKYMSDQVLPLFHGGMKVTFKHFPMDQSCNEELKKTLHPQACEAATAAEAALILGGNDAFWKAHDLLFASQADLRKFDYAAFAQQLGLDPEAFNKTKNDPATMERVKRDIALAREVGVDATPSLFLSGRRVPRLAVRQFRFWEAVAKVYDNALQYAIKQREKKEAAKSETGADSNAEPESEEPEHNEPQASTRPREVKRLTLTPSNPNP